VDIAVLFGFAMIKEPAYEQGAALIIVLGLVAVVSAWASTAAYEDMLSLHRADNEIVAAKAELACLSSLTLAKIVLKQDAHDSKYDDLNEAWAQETPPFPVDDGLVSGKLVDANRYFDLNALLDQTGKVDALMVESARRLFVSKDQDPLLVDALVDWMDKDDTPFGPGGAEDASYFSKPYRVKNASLDRLDELLLVQGFDHDVLQALQGVITVWPRSKTVQGKVNINTVEKDVLLSMFPAMSDADFSDMMSQRSYENIQDLQSASWAQDKNAKAMLAHVGVSSDRFIVKTHAIFGRADWQEEYGLLRQGEKLIPQWRERVIWRP